MDKARAAVIKAAAEKAAAEKAAAEEAARQARIRALAPSLDDAARRAADGAPAPDVLPGRAVEPPAPAALIAAGFRNEDDQGTGSAARAATIASVSTALAPSALRVATGTTTTSAQA